MSNLITPPPYFSDLVPVSADEYPACTARMDQHFPDIVSLQLVRSGSCFFGIDGGPLKLLDRPALFWHLPQHTYQYHPGPGGSWHHYWVSFNGARPQRLMQLGFASLAPQGYVWVRDAAGFANLFRRMIKLIRAARPASTPEIARILEEVLALLIAQAIPRASPDPHRRSVLAMADALSRRPFERVRWATKARELHVSPAHFRRLFRATIGSAPQAFLLNARVRRAAALLADPAHSVKAVALMAGYADPAQFTKSFRRVMGLSPSAYRQIHSGR